jgi:hypothetical protein
MTLTFGIQTPSSSSAIRVEKLVGHSRCEDGGLLTDAVLPSVWTEHHVKTAKITDVSVLTLKQRVMKLTPDISNLYHSDTVLCLNF